jgi:hypothetical protein
MTGTPARIRPSMSTDERYAPPDDRGMHSSSSSASSPYSAKICARHAASPALDHLRPSFLQMRWYKPSAIASSNVTRWIA